MRVFRGWAGQTEPGKTWKGNGGTKASPVEISPGPTSFRDPTGCWRVLGSGEWMRGQGQTFEVRQQAVLTTKKRGWPVMKRWPRRRSEVNEFLHFGERTGKMWLVTQT